jgi:ATPase subunit of ABC transporter with duplicated ATPase domains
MFPFDDLLGDEKTERELRKAAEASGRIALVGAMGAGKSSVLSYALTPSKGFAPIPISVAPESDETVTDPGRFAQHVVRVISTWTAEVEMLTPEQRDELLRSVAEGRVMSARSKPNPRRPLPSAALDRQG